MATSEASTLRSPYYLRLPFLPAGPFFAAFFAAGLAAFLGDFFAGFESAFFEVLALPPLKILSQLSEYFLLVPTRTTLMAKRCS